MLQNDDEGALFLRAEKIGSAAHRTNLPGSIFLFLRRMEACPGVRELRPCFFSYERRHSLRIRETD